MGDTTRLTPRNGLIEARSDIIRTVVLSATEAEYIASFMAALRGVYLTQMAESMGYPQRPTRIKTDNEASHGIANGTYQINRTKAINTRFHWLRQQIQQGRFQFIFQKGRDNGPADHCTKPLHKDKFYEARDQLGLIFPMRNSIEEKQFQLRQQLMLALKK